LQEAYKIDRHCIRHNPATVLRTQTSSRQNDKGENVGAKPSEKRSQDPALKQRNNSDLTLEIATTYSSKGATTL